MGSENWELVKLSNICTDVNYGYTQSATTDPVGPKFLRITDIVGNYINWDTVPFCPISDADRKKYKLEPGDIVIARTGATTGSTATIKEMVDSVFASYLIRYKVNQQIADPFFVGYVLKSKIWDEYVQGIIGGSAQPGANARQFGDFEFDLPPLPNQRRIAAILTALDDKIELNRRMNETLEGIAQAIWGEWFGKYANGEEDLPAGWMEYDLSELIETVSKTYKFDKDKIIFLNTSDILDGQVLTNEYSDVATLPGQAKKSIQRNDILYSEIRPANKRYAFVNFDAEEYVVSTKLMVLRSKGVFDPLLIYFYLTRKEILDHLQMLAESRSGTFPQITFEHIKNLRFRFPNKETVEKFTALLRPIYSKQFENENQSRTLAALRDALLPRLMRGEIEV